MRIITGLQILVLTSVVSAQDIWVDASQGNDANPGTATQPLKSWTAAANRATSNATIYVRGGLYGPATTGEVLPIRFGSTVQQNNIVIRGLGSVIFDVSQAKGTVLNIGPLASGSRITNITFFNMDTTDWWSKVIEAGSYKGPGSATGFEIDRCVFTKVNRGIVIWENSPPVTGWKIHDNVFTNLANDAINEFFVGSSNIIFNNTIVGGTYVGILSDSATAQIFNNIVTGVRDGISGGSTVVTTNIRNNDVWMNTNNWAGNITAPPTGNFSADPLFVSASDYHLQPSSPFIDQGFAGVPARADLDNNPGAVDSDMNGSVLPDLGAYEIDPVHFTAQWNGSMLTLQLAGPPGLGFVLFALRDGLVQLPGWSPILLDPATLFSFAVTGGVPLNASFPVPPQAAGSNLVMQGGVLGGALVLSNQQWVQF